MARVRAPTDELTRSLRVRDLLGMSSGLNEPTATSLRFGVPTTTQVLESVVNLAVVALPGSTFYYNNTMYAVAGYLPFVAAGVAPADVRPAYTQAMHDRLFAPAGMTGARIIDDPRGVVDDFAVGNQFDLWPRPRALPFGPIGSYTPAGACPRRTERHVRVGPAAAPPGRLGRSAPGWCRRRTWPSAGRPRWRPRRPLVTSTRTT